MEIRRYINLPHQESNQSHILNKLYVKSILNIILDMVYIHFLHEHGKIYILYIHQMKYIRHNCIDSYHIDYLKSYNIIRNTHHINMHLYMICNYQYIQRKRDQLKHIHHNKEDIHHYQDKLHSHQNMVYIHHLYSNNNLLHKAYMHMGHDRQYSDPYKLNNFHHLK